MPLKYELINGLYNIADFDKVKDECQSFIDFTLQTETTKTARTLIRKKKNEIATFRKQANKALLMDFNGKCKELEAMLDAEDKNLTDIINADKEPAFSATITCKVYDEKTLQKAIQFLNELGLEVKQK